MREKVGKLLCLALVLVGAGAIGIPQVVAADDNISHSLFLPVIVKPTVPLPQSHILFSSDRARPGTGYRQIWIMNADGSDTKHLTDHELYNWGGKWSPNGQQILFTNSFLVDVEPLGPRAVPAIIVMNADGSDMRRVSQGNPHNLNPSWSSDSTRIVFERYQGEEGPNIHVDTADGASQRGIASGHQPVWSPVDEQIAYKRIDDSGNLGLYVIDADGSKPICLNCMHTFPPYSNGGVQPQWNWPFAWSPDGKWIAYFSRIETILYAISNDGTQLRQLSTAFPEASTVVGIDWSPDGQSIVLDRGPYGSPNKLYRITVNDTPSDPQVLAEEGSGGRWSPDGRWLAFFSDGITIMDADGNNVRPLTTFAGDVLPEWRPLQYGEQDVGDWIDRDALQAEAVSWKCREFQPSDLSLQTRPFVLISNCSLGMTGFDGAGSSVIAGRRVSTTLKRLKTI